MSRSNPTLESSPNPADRYFEWQGSTGKIKYYDREAKENIIVELPFKFIVLDQLNTITGYSKQLNSGYWANEVRNTITDKLVVRSSKGIEAEGLYADMPEILARGGKYAKSVYIGYAHEDGTLHLGNLKLFGSAIGPWIDFCKANKVNEIAVGISAATPATNGATDYFVPVFEGRQITEAANAQAIDLDRELQEYLTGYFNRNSSQSVNVAPRDEQERDEPEYESAIEESTTNDEPVTDATIDDEGKLKVGGIDF